jgi:very-short-patch-repair endonuclease
MEKLNGLAIAHRIASEKNGKCLSTEYFNSRLPLDWLCNVCGHEWQASLDSVNNGKTWCIKCYHNSLKADGLNIAKNIAERKGGKCLSTIYVGCHEPLSFCCNLNHYWNTSLSNLKHGNWCPECFLASRRLDGLKIANNIAQERNGKCLSDIYISVNSPLKWLCCICEYTWQASLYHIRDGEWCPNCAGHRKYTIEDYKQLAKEKDGYCLSESCGDQTFPLVWKCSQNHIWIVAPKGILYNNTWCPQCAYHKNQTLLGYVLSQLFPNQKICYEFDDFDWLTTVRQYKQHFDFYIPGLKVAIERDGEQHYHPIEYFGGQTRFENTKRLDAIKNAKVAEHPEDVATFIRISYTEPITLENIKHILLANGVKI